jgi:hypothetical protein
MLLFKLSIINDISWSSREHVNWSGVQYLQLRIVKGDMNFVQLANFYRDTTIFREKKNDILAKYFGTIKTARSNL